MPTLPIIQSCQTTSCSFNHDGCSAPAITVGGADQASCTTLIQLDARGGLPTAHGQVGTCQHLECTHNRDLLCTAESITVGSDGACLTYQTA